jgi:hypothetical protein
MGLQPGSVLPAIAATLQSSLHQQQSSVKSASAVTCGCTNQTHMCCLPHVLHVLQVLCQLAPMLSKHLYSVTPVVAQVGHPCSSTVRL